MTPDDKALVAAHEVVKAALGEERLNKYLRRKYVERCRELCWSVGVDPDASPQERQAAILAKLRTDLGLPPNADPSAIGVAVGRMEWSERAAQLSDLLQVAMNPGPIRAEHAGRIFALDEPVPERQEMEEAEAEPRTEHACPALPPAGAVQGAVEPPTFLAPVRRALQVGKKPEADDVLSLTQREIDALTREFHVKLEWSLNDPCAPFRGGNGLPNGASGRRLRKVF